MATKRHRFSGNAQAQARRSARRSATPAMAKYGDFTQRIETTEINAGSRLTTLVPAARPDTLFSEEESCRWFVTAGHYREGKTRDAATPPYSKAPDPGTAQIGRFQPVSASQERTARASSRIMVTTSTESCGQPRSGAEKRANAKGYK